MVANFSLFFNPAVRDMSQSDVGSLFSSNLVTVNGQSVLEPHFELSDNATGLYDVLVLLAKLIYSIQFRRHPLSAVQIKRSKLLRFVGKLNNFAAINHTVTT